MRPAPRLVAMAEALPPVLLDTPSYADIATRLTARVPREAALIQAISRRSGIDTRPCVLAQLDGEGRLRMPFYEERPADASRAPTTAERMEAYARLAPPLGIDAARRALVEAAINAGAVTHLVTASCTGFMAPGLDYALMMGLGLPPTTQRTHLGFMGCHAAINAMASASAICRGDARAVVVGTMVELCTLHFQHGLGRDNVLPNTLFGDGAAAFVMVGEEVELSTSAMPWRVVRTASQIIAGTADLMTWRIGDSGFRMTLDASVPDTIARHLPAFAARHGWSNDARTAWVIHPGGPRILDGAARALGLAPEATRHSRDVLRAVGNLSSATTLVILRRALACMDDNIERVVMLAFGPGLAIEAAELRRD